MSDNAISCECCQDNVRLARSVMLRGDIFRQGDMISAEWMQSARFDEKEWLRFALVYAQYKRNTDYRRAFVCDRCYLKLDSYDGTAEILTPTGPKIFAIAGKSRGSKAAVYTVAKWKQFQDRLWNQFLLESC